MRKWVFEKFKGDQKIFGGNPDPKFRSRTELFTNSEFDIRIGNPFLVLGREGAELHPLQHQHALDLLLHCPSYR